MKRWWIVLVLLILVGCTAKTVTLAQTNTPATETPAATTDSSASTAVTAPNQSTTSTPNYQFKLLSESGKRSPPTVFGIVQNIGKTPASVKVVARVYYAKVLADENSQVITNVAPGETAKYEISIKPTTQWTSFRVFLE